MRYLTILLVVFLSCTEGEMSYSDPRSVQNAVESQFLADIPKLMDKNLEQIIATLGKPLFDNRKYRALECGLCDLEPMAFKVKGRILVMFYLKHDESLSYFEIWPNPPSGYWQEKDKLYIEQIANIRDNDPRYKLKWELFKGSLHGYTSVKIIPNKSA